LNTDFGTLNEQKMERCISPQVDPMRASIETMKELMPKAPETTRQTCRD